MEKKPPVGRRLRKARTLMSVPFQHARPLSTSLACLARAIAGQFRKKSEVTLEFQQPMETPLMKLKRTLLVIAGDDTREAIKLVARVFAEIPELREQ